MKEILFSILSGNHNPAIKVPTALAVNFPGVCPSSNDDERTFGLDLVTISFAAAYCLFCFHCASLQNAWPCVH